MAHGEVISLSGGQAIRHEERFGLVPHQMKKKILLELGISSSIVCDRSYHRDDNMLQSKASFELGRCSF